MPYFPGHWFPRDDDTQQNHLYCASVLALLKPWRNLGDLKDPLQSFQMAYKLFIASSPEPIL